MVALSWSSVVSTHGSGCLFLPVYTSFKHSFRSNDLTFWPRFCCLLVMKDKMSGKMLCFEDLASDPDLQKVDFQIVPLANPDGYVFSMLNEDDHHFENRLKRKNMRDSGCPDPLRSGVDLNRNFPVGFNLSSHSDCYPVRGSKDGFCGCSDTYGGPQPFSEPETSALRNALTRRKPWIFVDIHASLGAWFTPPVSRSGL